MPQNRSERVLRHWTRLDSSYAHTRMRRVEALLAVSTDTATRRNRSDYGIECTHGVRTKAAE